jgi:hypothetical protein
MMKKITLGLAALLSTLSLSALAQARSPVDVNIPLYNGGFTFGLAGLYLRPNTESLDYGIVFPPSNPIALRNGSIKSVDPDYGWGYRANIGYIFPCTGNDVMFSYSRYDREDFDHTTVRNDGIFFSTITSSVAGFIASDDAVLRSDAKTKFRFETMDLDAGQHVNFGCNAHLRFLAGIRYAELKNTFEANYLFPVEVNSEAQLETITVNTIQTSKFKGAGPRVGLDADYKLGCGFSLVGETTGSILVGKFKTNFDERDLITAGNGAVTLLDTVSSVHQDGLTRMVPNLNAKLGLAYSYQFNNCSKTRMTVEAGYQAEEFFHTVTRHRPSGTLGFDVFGFPGNLRTLDVGFSGPYVNVQVKV